MGILDVGGAAGSMEAGTYTKKSHKNQVQANQAAALQGAQQAQRQAHFEQQMLEHMAFQSHALAAIRDLLVSQQNAVPPQAS